MVSVSANPASPSEADKRTRLAGVSAMIEAGQILLPPDAPWLAEFKQELLAFPSCRHDDQVDALSQLLIWVDRQQRFDHTPIAAPMIIEMDRRCDGWDDPTYLDDPYY